MLPWITANTIGFYGDYDRFNASVEPATQRSHARHRDAVYNPLAEFKHQVIAARRVSRPSTRHQCGSKSAPSGQTLGLKISSIRSS